MQTGLDHLDWGEPKKLPDTLLPKCRDFTNSRREPCLDPNAGPAQSPLIATAVSSASGGLRPREIRVENRNQQSQVKASPSKAGPIIYEFRIAHR